MRRSFTRSARVGGCICVIAAAAMLAAIPGTAVAQTTLTFTGTGDSPLLTGNGTEFDATAEAGGYRLSTPTNFLDGTAQLIPGLAYNSVPSVITDNTGTGDFTITMVMDGGNAALPDFDENTGDGGSSVFNGTTFGIFVTFDSDNNGSGDTGFRIGWKGLDTDAGGGGISGFAFTIGAGSGGTADARVIGGHDGMETDVSGSDHTITITRSGSNITLGESSGDGWFSGLILGGGVANDSLLTALNANWPLVSIGFYANEEDGALPAGSGLVKSFAVTFPSPPEFSTQPQGGIRETGGMITFEVELAAPDGPVSYQWFKDGSTPVGADSPTLTLTTLTLLDSGDYHCVATDNAGPHTSDTAVLIVVDDLPASNTLGFAALAAAIALLAAGYLYWRGRSQYTS